MLWPAIVVVGLLAATVWALVKRPAWGFLGAWFFGILALTSSAVPLGQAAFEHRMYLPLAAVVAGVVVGGWVAGQRLVCRGIIPLLACQVMGSALVLFAGALLGTLTFRRNVDYRSELSIWEDTVAKAPGNAQPYDCLGTILCGCGRIEEAIACYQKAVEVNPDYVQAYSNLGLALAGRGQIDEAIAHFQKALEIKPDYAPVHNNLGLALADRGRIDEAISHYQEALTVDPEYAEAHNNLANALANSGQFDEAIIHYQKALAAKPGYASAARTSTSSSPTGKESGRPWPIGVNCSAPTG